MKSKVILFTVLITLEIGSNAQGLAVGSGVADFALPDLNGNAQALSRLKGRNGTVIVFLSAQCPVVKAYKDRINQIASEAHARGVNFVGINANANESLPSLRSNAAAFGYRFPILIDRGNTLADRLDARTAPEVYFLNADNVLVYHGAIDNDYTGRRVTENYLAAALDASIAGQPIATTSAPPFGCTIRRGGM